MSPQHLQPGPHTGTAPAASLPGPCPHGHREEAATVIPVVASRGQVGSAGKGSTPLSLLGKQEEFHLGTNGDGRVEAAGALHGKYCPWGGTRGQTYYQELI